MSNATTIIPPGLPGQDLKLDENGNLNWAFDQENPGENTTVTNPTVANIEIVDSGIEYRYDLPMGTKYFDIKCRSGRHFLLAFESGKIDSGVFVQINGVYFVHNLSAAASVSLFFKSPKNGEVIEVVSWV